MMEGAGFEVVDLGINNPVKTICEAWNTKALIFWACPPF